MGAAGLGHPDRALGCADHRAAVADHHELGCLGLTGDQSRQALHIDAVEEAVHLVEGIERRRPEALQGEQEAQGGE